MLKKTGLALLALILIVLGLAALQPATFSVQRSIAIQAAPEKIMPLISDFHQWKSWSPWENIDPAMKRSFTGSSNQKGAYYAWDGNDEVGAGSMEIIEITPPSKLVIKLDFIRPFPSQNQTVFTLTPQGGGTLVTWTMSGAHTYLSKLMGLFVSMDSMVGKFFEQGLASMKSVSEK